MPKWVDLRIRNKILLYALPGISAISIKLIILWRARFSLVLSNRTFLALFVSLLGLNVCELVLFTYVDHPEDAMPVMQAYYIFALFSIFSILAVSLYAIDKPKPLIFVVPAVLSLVVIIPGMAISGVHSIGYSVSRVAGPYYPVIQFGFLLPFILSLALLCYGAFFVKDKSVKKKTGILLACLAPLIISSICIVVLMQVGFQINATVVVSFMVNIFLLGLYYCESRDEVYGLLATIPGTSYNDSSRALTRALYDPSISLEQAKEIMDIEKIKHALKLTEGNQSEAARLLGVSRPTICRRIKHISTIENTDSLSNPNS